MQIQKEYDANFLCKISNSSMFQNVNAKGTMPTAY
jgi:hypothetical protein